MGYNFIILKRNDKNVKKINGVDFVGIDVKL